MNTATSLRDKLYDYIRVADDKKVHAIYSLLENEIAETKEWWKDKLFVFKSVPLEVCTQCGERYYSAAISKKLDDLVKKQSESKIRPQDTIQVPVFNWQ